MWDRELKDISSLVNLTVAVNVSCICFQLLLLLGFLTCYLHI